MNFALVPVRYEEKEILRNLMELYHYEFSQYENRDVNNLGLFGYKYLDNYWTEDGRWAYFIKAGDKLAGFVMVGTGGHVIKDADYSVSEFFVMYKYRRMGAGKFAFSHVFNNFRGKWEVVCHSRNVNSGHFWKNAINECTAGNFTLREFCPECRFKDGTLGHVFGFNNSEA